MRKTGFALLLLSTLACGITPTATPMPTELPPTVTASPEPTNEPTREPTIAPTALPPMDDALQAPGRLAVVGLDGNISIYEAGQEPLRLTDDGGGDMDSARFYSDPTWSPDGWLSYVSLSFENGDRSLEVFAVRPGEGQPQTLHQTEDERYVYGYWSPAVCTSGPTCGRFAFLMSDDDGINFYLSETDVDTALLRESNSHYYSWAPDGNAMLWFRDGAELSIYDVASDSIRQEFSREFSAFQSPNWSPVDDRLLFAIEEEESANTLTVAENNTLTTISNYEGASAFSWSPDGEQVALVSGDTIPFQRLVISDADGGNPREATPLPNVLAYFWSPDSSKIALVTIEERGSNIEVAMRSQRLTRLQQDSEPVLVWYVVDAATGDAIRLAEFLPTQDQLYLLQFFDQYAQSHQVWSPDSRYIAYAEASGEDELGVIRIIDTTRPSVAPQRLTEGRAVVFSFD